MTIVIAIIAGGLLGLLYFGGLWLTVKKMMKAKNPGLLYLGSSLLRTAIVITGFYLISGSNWKSWVSCVAGFIIARLILMRFLSKEKVKQVSLKENQV